MSLIQTNTSTGRNGRIYICKKQKTEMDIFNLLKESYGASTRNTNHFESAINSIDWNKTFEADGETYFCVNGFVLTVENIDPFKEAWKPSVMFSDGSIISF